MGLFVLLAILPLNGRWLIIVPGFLERGKREATPPHLTEKRRQMK